MNFVANDTFPVTLASPSSGNKIRVTREFDNYFLLWGLLPGELDVDLATEVSSFKIMNAGNLSIVQKQTLSQQLLSFFSFGLYIPYTITIKAWSDKKEVVRE